MATQGDYRARFAAAFDKAIQEAQYAAAMDGLDLDFINNRSTTNTFKLTANDFQSVTHKNEIRFLIARRWFPDLDVSTITLPSISSVDAVNKSLNALYKENPSGFNELLQEEPKGVGPGEVLLYFILDNAYLGGGASAGVDIVDNGTKYEIKAVKMHKSTGTLRDFKLGGTVNISGVLSEIMRLKAELLAFNPSIPEGETTGINNTHLAGFADKKFQKHIKKNKIKGWDQLTKEFAKIAYKNYFKAHPIIFVGSKGANREELGRIYSILSVKEKMISMTVTTGTIKPIVDPNAK